MSNLKGSNDAIQQFHPFNLYGHDDGEIAGMSSEEKKKLAEIFEFFRPKLNLETKGQIIIYGTNGDLEDVNNLKDWFYVRP